jgi:sialidase-1
MKSLSFLLTEYFVIFLIFVFLGNKPAVGQEFHKYKNTVFNAGENQIDSYRIPSLITTKDGNLLAFSEARKSSSTDKTPTDIVVKRSTDNGKTWSKMQFLTHGEEDAFMDPVALVDEVTGKIFLFANRWPEKDHSMKGNTAWLITSTDEGLSWSGPKNVTDEITATGHFMNGFGPGSGIQMQGKNFKNRLVLPTRQYDGKILRNRTVYSDDHGEIWKIGGAANIGGEFEIAETPKDTLIFNLRAGKGERKKAWSFDGGVSWTDAIVDKQLETTADYGGCQASILGIDNLLFFTGPAGGTTDDMHEDRQNFKFYRSPDGGKTWPHSLLLFGKAAGYSDITLLKNGDLAIIFETADTEGFPKMIPGNRPPGWMRIDVIVLSGNFLQENYWIR